MSYAIAAYAISVEKLEKNTLGKSRTKRGLFARLFGPTTEGLIKKIKQRSGYRFEQDEDEEDQTLTLEQALVDLLDGNDLHSAYGDQYGYALELLCEHFGECLNSSAWNAMRIEWANQVQAEMDRAGIDEKAISLTNHILFRGPPFPIPKPNDSPAIGFLRNSEIDRAATAIKAADLSQADEEVEEAVLQIGAWLQRCTDLNCDLVCFYY